MAGLRLSRNSHIALHSPRNREIENSWSEGTAAQDSFGMKDEGVTSMNCSECKTHISEFLDGELSDLTSTIVRKHLRSCSECQRMLDEFLSLNFEMEQAIDSIPVPADLEERIITSSRLEHKYCEQTSLVNGPNFDHVGDSNPGIIFSIFPQLITIVL